MLYANLHALVARTRILVKLKKSKENTYCNDSAIRKFVNLYSLFEIYANDPSSCEFKLSLVRIKIRVIDKTKSPISSNFIDAHRDLR